MRLREISWGSLVKKCQEATEAIWLFKSRCLSACGPPGICLIGGEQPVTTPRRSLCTTCLTCCGGMFPFLNRPTGRPSVAFLSHKKSKIHIIADLQKLEIQHVQQINPRKIRHLSHTLAWLPHFFRYAPWFYGALVTSGAGPSPPSDLPVVVQWQRLVDSAGPPLECTSGGNVQWLVHWGNPKPETSRYVLSLQWFLYSFNHLSAFETFRFKHANPIPNESNSINHFSDILIYHISIYLHVYHSI